MSKSKNNIAQKPVLDPEYWKNEIETFEASLEGMRTAYALIKELHRRATVELAKLENPEKP